MCIAYFLMYFFTLNICIYCISRWFFLSLGIHLYSSSYIGSLSNSFFIKHFIFFHVLWYVFNRFLSLALKDIVLLLSKYLAYPILQGSFMHNGLISSLSSSYRKTYLNEPFVPYVSFSDITILLISTLFILIVFLFLLIALLLIFLSPKIHSFYTIWEK